jgi:hypothetical protein
VGDPALELARIAEYARLPENAIDLDEFRHGYASVRPVPDRREECWSVYHLDTAIMLAVVFTREAPQRAGRQHSAPRQRAGRAAATLKARPAVVM